MRLSFCSEELQPHFRVFVQLRDAIEPTAGPVCVALVMRSPLRRVHAGAEQLFLISKSKLFTVNACDSSCFFAVLCSMSVDFSALSTLESVMNSSYSF